MMKKMIIGGLAALATTLGIAAAGAAHADPTYSDITSNAANNGPFSGPMGDHSAEAYWVDMTSIGVGGTVAQAGKLANTICTGLAGGMSEGEEIAAMVNGVSSQVTQATLAVHAAEWHFCPSRY
jgi:hypothetical protein